ncbi:MAG: hypothetical protein C4294_14590, partial [Nitrospiraceae bacterium]
RPPAEPAGSRGCDDGKQPYGRHHSPAFVRTSIGGIGFKTCYNKDLKAITMSSTPIPQLPLYRITFFYGPESVPDHPPRVSCIFNVKKRSWKGGVQIEVQIDEGQLVRIRESLQYESWLKERLAMLPDGERDDYESRAGDLLVQEICSLKLTLALETDIRQENGCLPSNRFVSELDHAVLERAERIKLNVLTELDLHQG